MNHKFSILKVGLNLLIVLLLIPDSFGQANEIHLKFDLGEGEVNPGYTQLSAETKYDTVLGYGFISNSPMINVSRKMDNPLLQDFCTSEEAFYFVIDLPDGNYEIKLHIGDQDSSSITTVKAESRRLMCELIETEPGEFLTETIIVNVRTPKINQDKSIRLKSRELPYLNWDNKLTLEFNNSRPCINAIEIKSASDVRTVFLAGNSTVTDQEHEPWCSWGQMITNFFTEEIVVTNLAESGESLKSFKAERRLMKLLSMIEPDDYVFIEFGHNDQKPQSSSYVEAFTGYKDELKDYIAKIRSKGGIPILVSPTSRRAFDSAGTIINTHGDYPKAMQQTAHEESVPFIDLNSMSKILYETLGVENSKKALVHYPANSFPGQDKDLADNTHFNTYGAYQLAKCILQGIIDLELDVDKYIINFEAYDPGKPDPYEEFNIPSSPAFLYLKPDGN